MYNINLLIDEVSFITHCDNLYVIEKICNSAVRKVLLLTNRTEMIDELYQYALEYSLAMYNKLGNEGQSSNNEGGVSITYSLEDTLKGIEQYRLNNIARGLKNAKNETV